MGADPSTHERGDAVLDSGLTYDGIARVTVHVTQRGNRYRFSDGGGAVEAAGVTLRRRALPDRIRLGERSVNVSGWGVVWLPAVESAGEEWLAEVPRLVAEGSVALYERLLDASD